MPYFSERICVCGLGKVGKPILDTFRMKGFQVVGYDSDPARSEIEISEAVSVSEAAIFIVPTPSLPTGAFSNIMLRDALSAFNRQIRMREKRGFLYIISSTTTPGSCSAFKEIVGENLCYKPEFIRLAHVRDDLISPAFILIGEGSPAAGDRCENIFRGISDVPVFRMSLLEAELAKITLNCALTAKISIANQLHLVAERLGANSEKIMAAVGADPRIGSAYLKPGLPFGGPCLPRDNRMFAHVAEKAGVEAHLSIAIDKINDAVQAAHYREVT